MKISFVPGEINDYYGYKRYLPGEHGGRRSPGNPPQIKTGTGFGSHFLINKKLLAEI